jgi:cell division ATPase FtsA
MRNERVAVLDIRSFEVTFLLASKGVNDTFVFCGSKSEKYEGYSTEGFFDEKSFCQAVRAAAASVLKNYDGKIEKIFVGTPAPFIKLRTMGHTNSFPSKRKVTHADLEALYDSGVAELMESGRIVHRSSMYFALGDNRKYFEEDQLYGVPTSLLKGALCYYFVSEPFYDVVVSAVQPLGFKEVEFLPASLAQATYLLPSKEREGYAFLLDIGFMASTVSVVYGNGIVHEESFDCGLGGILVRIMEQLGVDYERAERILQSANISGGYIAGDKLWVDEESGESYPEAKINDIIKCGLDELCERVQNFFAKHYREKAGFMSNPLSLTGEGLVAIAGASEHISKRLSRITQVVAPELPYYDKPNFSSRISVLAAALGKVKKKGLFARIFGGKKK